MARSLTSIQTLVRFFSRDNSLVLTADPELTAVNSIYRALAGSFEWPELTRRAIITSPTVIDQENYEWTGEDFPTLLDVNSVEIKSLSYDFPTTSSSVFNVSSVSEPTARYTWKHCYQPPDEFEWDLAGRMPSVDMPKWYKRFLSNRHILVAADVGDGSNRWHSVNDGSTWVQSTSSNIGDEVRYYAATAADGTGASTATDTNRIALRPTPSVAGYEIRITGVEEPAALTVGGSTTVFILSSSDDAFVHLISAHMSARDGLNEIYQYNIQQATQILNRIFTAEKITKEEIQGLA